MNVYLVEIGQLSELDNKFHFYDKYIFSSKKSMENYVNSVLEVDKATDIKVADSHPFYAGEKKRKILDFTTMSVEDGINPSKPMKMRFVISHMKPHIDVGPRNGFRFDKSEVEVRSSRDLSEVKTSEAYGSEYKIEGTLGSAELLHRPIGGDSSEWAPVDIFAAFEQQEADVIGKSEVEKFQDEMIRLFGLNFLRQNVLHFKGV